MWRGEHTTVFYGLSAHSGKCLRLELGIELIVHLFLNLLLSHRWLGGVTDDTELDPKVRLFNGRLTGADNEDADERLPDAPWAKKPLATSTVGYVYL